jgi:hypothetical protein
LIKRLFNYFHCLGAGSLIQMLDWGLIWSFERRS